MPASSPPNRPEVRTEPTPAGIPTLIVNGRCFHSRRQPRKEAERAAGEVPIDAATLAFVLSPGLGYLSRELERRGATVVNVERHPEIAAVSGLSSLVALTDEAIYEFALAHEALARGKVIVHAGAALDEDAAYYAAARGAILRAVDKRAEEIITHRGFDALWEANLRANRSFFQNARWITELDGSLAGRAAVILAAGPSLAATLPSLAAAPPSLRDRCRVIAVDSALPAARAAGAAVDLCVTIDPQPLKAAALIALGETPLVASVLSPPEILSRARQIYFFGQGHPGEAELRVPPAAVLDEPGGSVATAAVTLSLRWGARAVILVGQDLAFIDDSTHAAGTLTHELMAGEQGRFRQLEQLWRSDTRRQGKLRSVPAADGGEVMTTPALDSYRHFLGKLAQKHPEVRFYSTSRRGALLPDFQVRDLADCLRK